MERMRLRGTDGHQWAFQSTNDPQAHAASIRLLSSPQQCIRDVIVQVSTKQPPHKERTEAGITQSSDRRPTVGRMYMGTERTHMEKRGGCQRHKALSLAVRRRAGLIASHPRLQSRDDFPRYQAGYRLSHHMNERWEN